MKTLSEKNPFYIPKERYLELKHFCLQYRDLLMEEYKLLNEVPANYIVTVKYDGPKDDSPLFDKAIRLMKLENKTDLIEAVCRKTDHDLANYILIGVTTPNVNYEYLQHYMRIPCSKGLYYDRYRKFFWLLDKEKD